MKKNIILAAGAVLVAAAVSAFVYVNSGRNTMDDLFNTNVEALARYEIIVGDLCMVCPNYACYSLGEVYIEHYPA